MAKAATREKYISQADRRQAKTNGLLADPKNLGFPARSQAEFDAAVTRLNSIGGDSSARAQRVKRNLIRIAHKQNYTLPDAWQKDAEALMDPAPGSGAGLTEALGTPGAMNDQGLEEGDDNPVAQDAHRLVVSLGAPCPGLPWGYYEYENDLPTSPEQLVLRDLHEATLELGAHCCLVDDALIESLRPAREAGRRHSDADQQALNRAHKALIEAGAECMPAGKEAATRPAPPAAGSERVPLCEGAGALPVSVVSTGGEGLRGEAVVRIIQPGFNASQSRYYTPAAVAAIADAMQSRKMYVDHATEAESRERPERSLTELASVLTKTWVDSKDGAAYGQTTIVNPDFLALVERLSAAGQLDQLGASINAVGIGSKGEIEGVATFVVTDIDRDDGFRSVDWVTEPGAGGRAVLVESAGRAEPAREQTMATNTDNLDSRIGSLEETLGGLGKDLATLIRTQTLDGLLAGHRVAEAIKGRVRASLLPGTEALTAERVAEAVKAELDYVRTAAGKGSTGVQGFGSAGAGTGSDDGAGSGGPDPLVELRESLKQEHPAWGDAELSAALARIGG